MRLELSTMRAAGPGPSGGLMSQWRVGAIVEAIAVRDISDGQLWLNIGATRIPARIASGDASGPTNGERLQLRVLRDHPVLALETLAGNGNDNETTATSDALRRFLPKQSSPAPLLANLAWLSGHSEDSQQLSRTVANAVEKLWASLPEADELSTPTGLVNAVKRSGNFLEANLANTEPADVREMMGRDFKALLLNLKQTLQRAGANSLSSEQPPGPLPTLRGALTALDSMPASLAAIQTPTRQMNELAGQAEGALARINTAQLVNGEAANAGAWLIELPFKREGRPEMLRFRFERNSQRESAEQSWSIEAALTLGATGTVNARVSLYGKRVSVQLHAEPPQLVADLAAQTPLLTATLSEAGLEVDRVLCFHGMPAADRDAPTTSLLDIRV